MHANGKRTRCQCAQHTYTHTQTWGLFGVCIDDVIATAVNISEKSLNLQQQPPGAQPAFHLKVKRHIYRSNSMQRQINVSPDDNVHWIDLQATLFNFNYEWYWNLFKSRYLVGIFFLTYCKWSELLWFP